MASDATEKSQQPGNMQPKKKTIATYFYAACWILSFYFLYDYLQLQRVFLSLEIGFTYVVSVLASCGFALCFLYLSVYLPFKGVKVDYSKWETDAPKTIQLASVFMVVSFISWCLTLWSHFHMATPLILFTAAVRNVINYRWPEYLFLHLFQFKMRLKINKSSDRDNFCNNLLYNGLKHLVKKGSH
jgi:hypothetical protein